jgi:glycosyltransferase involved in cell wall biosynthesis
MGNLVKGVGLERNGAAKVSIILFRRGSTRWEILKMNKASPMNENEKSTIANTSGSLLFPVCPLGVIMPVFNESRTLELILPRILSQRCVAEVIAINDGSTDDSLVRLESWKKRDGRVTVVSHQKNRGKGAAIRTGLRHLTAPVVIIQDADMEYNPDDYGRMLKLIHSGRADVVYGSRFLAGARRVNSFWHTMGNRALTLLSNLACNLNLTDEATGYKMFSRHVLEQITLEEDGFGFCPEITAKVSKLGIRIYEVPIDYCGRTLAEGKKIRLRDGLGAIRCIIKYNFFRRKSVSRQVPNEAAKREAAASKPELLE